MIKSNKEDLLSSILIQVTGDLIMSTLRVGVLMGGRGAEREVSLNSGRTICDHLDTFTYTIIPLFQTKTGSLYILPWRFVHRGKTTDFEHRLEHEADRISWDTLKDHVDFIYLAMHGRFAEDGTLQGLLEVLQIPYLGSKVLASALGMDKVIQKKVLTQHGIAVPKFITLTAHDIPTTDNPLGYPCIVKPNNEGSSIGITVVQNEKDFKPALEKAAQYDAQTIVVEKLIRGMEFCCVVITDNTTGELIALPPTEIVPETEFLDYEQKYMPGRATKFTPARCSKELLLRIQQTAVAATKALGFKTLGRIDGFVTTEGAVIITDPNSLAGMAPSSFVFRQAAEIGMSHTSFINHLIETELLNYGITNNKQEIRMNEHTKKKIGVLFGGRSNEKEISLESGRNIIYKLSPHKYEPIALFVSDDLKLYAIDQHLLVRNSTKEVAHGLTPDMRVAWNDLHELVDFVFIGLHGDVGENGSIQGTLEMLNIPYNGSSVLTSALCNNKHATAEFLRSEGFDVPTQYLVEKASWKSHKEQELANISQQFTSKELIVKPADDGCSTLVTKVATQQELINAIDAILATEKDCALIEEHLTGMELTVGIIGNTNVQALPPSQAISADHILSIEEKFLPGAGENQTPAPLPQTAITFIQKTLEHAYKALGCKGYVRIDCFYQTAQESLTNHERLVILEVNTLPGLTPATCIFHQAAEIGLKPMEFIDLIIALGFEEFSRRSSVVADSHEHSRSRIAMAPPALETV